jgi:D-serine deaminase-like pyridoxal phosphate-dependent protein
MVQAPTAIGAHVSDVDTPALLIDLDALERNIRRMQERAANTKVRLRPHSKTHKSTTIANMQMAAGAIGVCCQKVSEAEIMVDGGISDVAISNEVAGKAKIDRVAALARRAKVSVCVDDAGNVQELAAAAVKFGSTIDVLVELNVGGNRCGVESAEDVARLAAAISSNSSLRFVGIQAYHGAAQHLRTFEDRRGAIDGAVKKVVEATSLLGRNGLACEVITGAGTGTFEFEMASGVYNELQVGSYVFMDVDYGRNTDRTGRPVSDFANALFIWTTVMSYPVATRAVVDAGLKALSVDSGMPRVVEQEAVSYVAASDEHGRLEIKSDGRPFRLGDKIRLIPGHCDPTVNLHDWFVGIRNAHVESLWPVSARGAVF